jgi:hypothetical protein
MCLVISPVTLLHNVTKYLFEETTNGWFKLWTNFGELPKHSIDRFVVVVLKVHYGF